MQGSGSEKDPGPGTQTQTTSLQEQLKSQVPLLGSQATWDQTHVGGEGTAMARLRDTKDNVH